MRSCQDAAQHELPHHQAASEEARPQVEPPASERCLRRRGSHARGTGRGLLHDRHAYEQLVLTFVRMHVDRRQAAPQDRVHAVGQPRWERHHEQMVVVQVDAPVTRVHALAGRVDDAHGAEDAVQRLAEQQLYLVGSARQTLAIGRCAAQQDRVGGGGSRPAREHEPNRDHRRPPPRAYVRQIRSCRTWRARS